MSDFIHKSRHTVVISDVVYDKTEFQTSSGLGLGVVATIVSST